jgi:tripartite ATP-independent transporter DctM subunit
MSPILITVIMFGGLLILLAMGLPLSFVLGGVGVIVMITIWGPNLLFTVASQTFATMWNLNFVAIPLFIYMGIVLERSGVAEALFDAFYVWSGRLRGGLAIATVVICAIMAAMTASSAAATITMGLIALPAMLKRGYDKELAVGVIGAGGTLGPLIPPSSLMILLGVMNQLSIGELFMAGFMPGLVFAGLFILYVIILGIVRPKSCPASPEKFNLQKGIFSLKAVILPVLIIVAVLGSIFVGIATPTESAAVGALAVIIATGIHRRISWKLIKESSTKTLEITAMVVWIFFGAFVFAAVYTGLGGIDFIKSAVLGLGVNRWVIFGMMNLVLLILGMVLDPGGIIVITSPIFFPIIRDLGFDPIWFSSIFVMNLMVGYLTPPVGYNIFYLKAVSPPEVSLMNIYRGFIPFIFIMILGLVIVAVCPPIALWLPSVMIH